jgi:hypothetical protein
MAADNWKVGDVVWLRNRHSFWAQHYSFQIESHTLELFDHRHSLWSLWVVIERWWGERSKDAVRFTEWTRVTKGDSRQVVRWLREQARTYGFE